MSGNALNSADTRRSRSRQAARSTFTVTGGSIGPGRLLLGEAGHRLVLDHVGHPGAALLVQQRQRPLVLHVGLQPQRGPQGVDVVVQRRRHRRLVAIEVVDVEHLVGRVVGGVVEHGSRPPAPRRWPAGRGCGRPRRWPRSGRPCRSRRSHAPGSGGNTADPPWASAAVPWTAPARSSAPPAPPMRGSAGATGLGAAGAACRPASRRRGGLQSLQGRQQGTTNDTADSTRSSV